MNTQNVLNYFRHACTCMYMYVGSGSGNSASMSTYIIFSRAISQEDSAKLPLRVFRSGPHPSPPSDTILLGLPLDP